MAPRTTAEDKRRIILNIFHTKAEPFTRAEMEKIASKAGVRQQVVKEVIDELVGDNFVDQEKIGINQIFWSFPSAATQKLKFKIKEATEKVAGRKRDVQELERSIAQASKGKEDTQERRSLVSRYNELLDENSKLKEKLKVVEENDPVYIEEVKEDAMKLVDAAHRWTDNMSILRDSIKRKFNVSEVDANSALGIEQELLYLDEMKPELFGKKPVSKK
eukprot:ANDGO_07963.mRNA.1 Meiotic nuclear division protein 1 homolog